ncbi:hypothetical protein FHY31_002319 [Xanthomonas euvesicatoria]|uniref:Uncharacterized protein n=1 Tax=Xanthomonas euvesicatoria TaxID=456327 RepID=A0AAW3U3Z5_XANEU|nr:hypothetical protein [Xanthomonas euvesicatoria]MBB4870557.1 hypothetical protein [Xanthomonas euvesicatoria]
MFRHGPISAFFVAVYVQCRSAAMDYNDERAEKYRYLHGGALSRVAPRMA